MSFTNARAEALPVAPHSCDLVFSVDVIHHVGDTAAHFRSALRALRPGGHLCTVTDSEWIIRNRQPLSQYFPETVEVELRRYPAIGRLRAEMAGAGFTAITEQLVEFPYRLTDIAPYRAKAYSALHLITAQAFERGLARMEHDLLNGHIACNSRYALLWASRAGGSG